MEPDQSKPRHVKTHRDEFQVAYSTRELRRTVQRKMLQQPMESTGYASTSAHGEDRSFDSHSSPPQDDRAG